MGANELHVLMVGQWNLCLQSPVSGLGLQVSARDHKPGFLGRKAGFNDFNKALISHLGCIVNPAPDSLCEVEEVV